MNNKKTNKQTIRKMHPKPLKPSHQILICSIAFGFWGHKYSYLSYDVFNRLDFIATLGCGLELIALLVPSIYFRGRD